MRDFTEFLKKNALNWKFFKVVLENGETNKKKKQMCPSLCESGTCHASQFQKLKSDDLKTSLVSDELGHKW